MSNIESNKTSKMPKIIANVIAFIFIVLEWIYIFFDIKNSLANITLIRVLAAIIYVGVGIGVTFLILFLSKPIEKILGKIFK